MSNYQHRLFFFITLFAGLSSLLFFPREINAEQTSISISPALIQIKAKPPADVWTPFTIENNGIDPISLKIGYKAFDPQASSNGTVVFLNDGQSIKGADKNIFQKMEIVDDQNISHDSIDIGPKQQMRFRLRITLPENEPISDYYFSLIFLQTPSLIDQNATNDNVEEQKSVSSIQSGMGINVLLAVGDKEAPQGSIDNFSAPWFINNGPVIFNLSVNNSGNHFIIPYGKLIIKNLFGQTVEQLAIPPSIVLAGTSRNFISNINTKSASTTTGSVLSSNNQDQGLNWPVNFILGSYTATLTLTLSSSGPVYIRTIHFIGFPINLFFEILLVLCIFIYIYLRVKRKLH
jgi:hypothetical protein